MPRLPLAVLFLLVLAAAPARTVADEDNGGSPTDDLLLDAWLTTPKEILPGQPVRLGARITNLSSTRAWPVVLPGDGSASGLREPEVTFRAALVSPRGVETPVAEKAVLRCGNLAGRWQDDVVVLAPGKSVDLTDRLMPASSFVDFQAEGSHVVRLHYAWNGGSGDAGGMDGVAPYRLVSNGVALHVRRPLDLRLDGIGKLVVGEARTLADLVTVRVENRTREALDFRGGQLRFELRGLEPPDLLDLREAVTPTARVRAAPLRPGAIRTFAGAEDFRFLTHLRLRAARTGKLEVGVVWAPGSPRDVAIRSTWVTIEAIESD